MIDKIDLGETINSYADFENLIKTIEKEKNNSLIYNKWTKASNPLSAKGTKISSKKMPYTAKMSDICEDLIKVLQLFKDHLHHAYMQFKRFKSGREEIAIELALKIHIDWSKREKLRQARDDEGAYYNETQVFIHCKYI